jgi:hypothetical protein
MGTKPGIALIGVVLTGITLSGCESSKPWGQDRATVSTAQSSNPTGYPASAWANQGRMMTNSPLSSTGQAVPASQSARITDPGLNSGATTPSLNPASNQLATPTSPTGFSASAADSRFPTTSQATYSGLPSSQTSTGGIDQSSRIPNTGTATSPAQQPAWPTAPSAGGGMGSPQSVPTMPRPGQSPNE